MNCIARGSSGGVHIKVKVNLVFPLILLIVLFVLYGKGGARRSLRAIWFRLGLGFLSWPRLVLSLRGLCSLSKARRLTLM